MMLSRISIGFILGAILVFQLSREQDDEGGEDAAADGAAEGGDGAGGDESGDSKGNNTDGEKLWEEWNKTGMDEKDRTWLIKFCPKGVLENYEATCIAHCWWNGWQGGMCTNDNICVCKWEGILEDLDATGANSLRLKGVSNTTGDPNVEAGDGAPVDEEKPAEPADDEGRK